MAAVDVDVVESALRDVNLSSGRETVLKPEQESAVRALLADRDVLAVLPTRYCKSLIYQMFVRVKNYELNGNAAILVISPLKSIIEDQLQEMDLLGYPAKDLANLSNDDIRRCNFKIAFATAEKVKEKPFRAMLVDSKSKLHRNISAILVDESLNSVDRHSNCFQIVCSHFRMLECYIGCRLPVTQVQVLDQGLSRDVKSTTHNNLAIGV